MRCLMCGHDMVLTAALPAEDGLVLGFEQQTLQCRACGETWRRFVFTPAVNAAAAKLAKRASSPACTGTGLCPSSNEKDKSVPSARDQARTKLERPAIEGDAVAFDARESTSVNGNDTRPERWSHAVEKFRRYEAALNRRADSRMKSNANGTRPFTTSRIQRPKSPPQRSIPIDFDALWNGHMPDQQKEVERSVASASLVPLPRALSLVVIEPQEATPDTRGDKHGSKKMLEKLHAWLTRVSAMPQPADLV